MEKTTNVLADNKKAHFDYQILEKLQAGIVLTGQEAKSAKTGGINLKGAFVTFHNNETMLTNAHINKYKFTGGLEEYDPKQPRKLLLKKREAAYLRGKAQEKGLTIIPLLVYTKNHLIKVEIAIARGKHEFDKRESLKKRDVEKEIRQKLKGSDWF